MNTLGWKFESEILNSYGRVIRRLMMIPPVWIERKLNGEVEAHKTPPIVKIFFLLVIGLSLASISNIGIRAYYYHANLFSYITGACFALVVPASVYVAAHMKGLTRQGRSYTWAVAAFAALLSSFIQVKLYMTETDITLATWLSGNIDIEALSFSAGIPFFEVLIASLAAMISDAHERALQQEEEDRKQQERASKVEAEAESLRQQAEAEAKAEREHQRLMERQRQENEMRAQQAEREQQLRIQEQSQLAEIEAKKRSALLESEAKAEAIRLAATAKVERAKAGGKPATESATSQKPAERSQSTSHDDQMAMLTIYQSEPTLSDEKMAARIGKSKKTIQDLLADLSAKKVVHIEKVGRGKTVAVNGKFAAFKAGEI
jgi:chemotaxis protein histidine kinase CheA